MQDTIRAHAEIGRNPASTASTSKDLVKQDFGRRVYRLMIKRGWTQSELSRQADLPRDSISVYVRGVSLPTPESLKKLAGALGAEPEELLPNNPELSVDADLASLELRISAADPSRAWLRLERLLSARTASKIVELIAADDAAMKQSGERERGEMKETLFDLLGQTEPEADFDFDPPRIGEFPSHE